MNEEEPEGLAKRDGTLEKGVVRSYSGGVVWIVEEQDLCPANKRTCSKQEGKSLRNSYKLNCQWLPLRLPDALFHPAKNYLLNQPPTYDS